MSHPSWVCGLKRSEPSGSVSALCVTPFVGVWIETCHHVPDHHPLRVTPFVGVWIETKVQNKGQKNTEVTPFVGVWIETMLYTYSH